MPYVLETIAEQDKQKILRDAECAPQKKARLASRRHLERPRFTWAVDREDDSYVIGAPVGREQSGDQHFYFYCRQVLYAVHLDGLFGTLVHFDDPDLPSGTPWQELEDRLRAALMVYGRFGGGCDKLSEVLFPSRPEMG